MTLLFLNDFWTCVKAVVKRDISSFLLKLFFSSLKSISQKLFAVLDLAFHATSLEPSDFHLHLTQVQLEKTLRWIAVLFFFFYFHRFESS